jgi:hypothetical protein
MGKLMVLLSDAVVLAHEAPPRCERLSPGYSKGRMANQMA